VGTRHARTLPAAPQHDATGLPAHLPPLGGRTTGPVRDSSLYLSAPPNLADVHSKRRAVRVQPARAAPLDRARALNVHAHRGGRVRARGARVVVVAVVVERAAPARAEDGLGDRPAAVRRRRPRARVHRAGVQPAAGVSRSSGSQRRCVRREERVGVQPRVDEDRCDPERCASSQTPFSPERILGGRAHRTLLRRSTAHAGHQRMQSHAAAEGVRTDIKPKTATMLCRVSGAVAISSGHTYTTANPVSGSTPSAHVRRMLMNAYPSSGRGSYRACARSCATCKQCPRAQAVRNLPGEDAVLRAGEEEGEGSGVINIDLCRRHQRLCGRRATAVRTHMDRMRARSPSQRVDANARTPSCARSATAHIENATRAVATPHAGTASHR
jgi:hypothetical protein